MLLTETIKRSTSAINKRDEAKERKNHEDDYKKALDKLAQVCLSLNGILDVSDEMVDKGLIDKSIITEEKRAELLESIDECGRSIYLSNLGTDTVKAFQFQVSELSNSLLSEWKHISNKYSEGPVGYLSVIMGLLDESQRARDLVNRVSNIVEGRPSKKSVDELVTSIADIKTITDSFKMSTNIEMFFEKVSKNQATILDLTPEILSWIRERNVESKLKIKF